MLLIKENPSVICQNCGTEIHIGAQEIDIDKLAIDWLNDCFHIYMNGAQIRIKFSEYIEKK